MMAKTRSQLKKVIQINFILFHKNVYSTIKFERFIQSSVYNMNRQRHKIVRWQQGNKYFESVC